MGLGGLRRRVDVAALAACVAATALVGAAAAQQAAAQQSGDAADATALPDIEVIGRDGAGGWNGASDRVYDTPGSVSEISGEAIAAQGGARNAGDLFRGVSGVTAVFDRQNPGLNVNIRGLQDQGRVNMSIDGARQNFQQAGHGATAFAYIDPELIGGVDIEKGPSSLAGGAGVIGGVVNFRTLDFEDVALPGHDYGARINATTGTNAFDFNGSMAAAARVSDDFEIVAAVGRKKLGEYDVGKRGDVTQVGSGDAADYTTQDQWSWLAKAKANLADDKTLTLSYTGLSAKYVTGSGQTIDSNKVVNHTAVADYRWTPGLWWADLDVKLTFSRTADDQFRPARMTTGTPPKVSYPATSVDYAIDTYGASVQNVSRLAAGPFDLALTYGGEIFYDKTDTAAVLADPSFDPTGSQFSGANPVGERGVGGVFAQAELKRDWLQIIGGLRYDRFGMTGSGVVFDGQTTGCGLDDCPSPFKVDVSGGHLSPTATVAVTPFQGVQLYSTYKQGWRPPNIMESILGGEHIGGNTGIFFAPNPDLKPEISKTVEAGANFKFDGVLAEGDAFRAKASVYSTHVDDYITQALVYDAAGGHYYRNVNLESPTRLKGIDLEANYDAGYAYVGGSASFINAHYSDDYDAGPNPRATGIISIGLAPKTKLSLDGGLRFFDRALTVGGRLTHVKPESNIGAFAGTYKYETYTLLDAYASYKLDERITFRASVENIRDVAYVDALSSQLSPSPGRTFTIGVTARL
ncbi:MAG: TonB-dependent hemoglobin/transferrin/lactoferrin family receptor [Hansschlegelia sp.]